MDTLDDDPETVEDFTEIAKTLHITTEQAVGIFFVVFSVVSMGVSLGIWYMHHRYKHEQRRRAENQDQLCKSVTNGSNGSSEMLTEKACPPKVTLNDRDSVDAIDEKTEPPTPLNAPLPQKGRMSKTYSLSLLDMYVFTDKDNRWTVGRSSSYKELP